jgi:hypothetical protein
MTSLLPSRSRGRLSSCLTKVEAPPSPFHLLQDQRIPQELGRLLEVNVRLFQQLFLASSQFHFGQPV